MIFPPDLIKLDGELAYVVMWILDYCLVSRNHLCEDLVSFVGYDTSHNEWLHEHNLKHANYNLQVYKTSYDAW